MFSRIKISTLVITLSCSLTFVSISAASGANLAGVSGMTGQQEKQQQQKEQQQQAAPPLQASPEAKPEDVASMEAILAALYDVISGPAGKKRDWDRMRSLFIPEGRLMAVGPKKAGGFGYRVMTVDDYIKANGEYLEKNGFFEREVARAVERFGEIAHVFSTYEARHKADDAKPFMRGINSIQLMHDGKRWWIVSVYWEAETPNNPLPEKYLKTKSE